ncbi:hypothetical protein GCM10008023_18870 [Sphingomonas glacialis]|uniref:Uncharacterized protein n=1 Tax=Sphingomonas glacialis TaxID=658225 RepID=A0ABQ3LHJ2_9SPHN|nr:hypothetical protein GCM10008023_18870 [Sphingomonas glacialis]
MTRAIDAAATPLASERRAPGRPTHPQPLPFREGRRLAEPERDRSCVGGEAFGLRQRYCGRADGGEAFGS